ncbi:MAG: hypothetical protein REI93_14905, partial [Pedobacter sp.]|nr:hypothetical protein [Pedobacter sp.]
MMEEDKVLWVARYEEDDLSATERAEFEQQLPQDRQLQQHLSDYREIHRSLQMELGENADD